jgi:hypothetical protein
LETIVGSVQTPKLSDKDKHGIDIVLGAQWGDEGKGKLVDVLSQVSYYCYYLCISRLYHGICICYTQLFLLRNMMSVLEWRVDPMPVIL